jgi:hypothetical protein
MELTMEEKPVIEGVSSEDSCMKPTEAPPAPSKGFHEKPWGMSHQDFAQYMSLVCMGLERCDNRQRYLFKKVLRPIIKELRVRWPQGRPIEDIQREIAEQQAKAKIIIPKGVNADALKEPPHA